ncbi:hypothetical protein B0H13DRAFT_854768 [Mycena leptocephala]|nr:hypothetical protein B0H13DRAFT_854768 [Mycena leptocephala]
MLRFWRLPWRSLLLSGRLRSPGRLHTRGGVGGLDAGRMAGWRDGASTVPRVACGYSGMERKSSSRSWCRERSGRGRGRVARNDGARLRLGVGTSIPHRALSLASLPPFFLRLSVS